MRNFPTLLEVESNVGTDTLIMSDSIQNVPKLQAGLHKKIELSLKNSINTEPNGYTLVNKCLGDPKTI